MGNIFDLLILLLGFFDVSVFGDWVQMIKRYRVYVSEEETCSMPNNVLGFYQRGVGRWGVHIISVDKNLPENLKIAVLLHEYAHFVEYINNKSRKKGIEMNLNHITVNGKAYIQSCFIRRTVKGLLIRMIWKKR